VVPLISRIAAALGNWLGESFGGGLRLVPDLDEIPALSSEREALWKRVGEAAKIDNMNGLIRTFTERGDLAHLALFLWASASSALLVLTLRELFRAQARFDAFVRELARFNRRIRK
jgi:hypothetical protein